MPSDVNVISRPATCASLSTRSTVNTVNAERIDSPITGTIDWESQDRASMSYEMVIHMGSIAQMVANMGQGQRSTYMAITGS